MTMDPAAERSLLATIKSRMPELEALLDRARSHWEYEDHVYRFYHGSLKVFGVQTMTEKIVNALRGLLPDAARVLLWRKRRDVGEVQIERHDRAALGSRCRRDIDIRPAVEHLLARGANVVTFSRSNVASASGRFSSI